MFRILLPIALIASFYIGPLSTTTTTDHVGALEAERKAWSFIEPTFDCVMAQDFSFSDECRNADNELMGLAFSAAAGAAVIAAVFGVLGLVHAFSGIAGFFSVIAGLVGFVAVAWYGSDLYFSGGEDVSFDWGFWSAGGLSLLLALVGLVSMRSE